MDYEKQIPRILFIGLIWGIIELYLSPVLRTLEPALFGITMPFLTTLIILTGRYFVPEYGSVILMAVIAATLEYLLGGMILHGAFMAILIEAVLAELILSVLGLNILSFILVGISVECYSLIHPLITRGEFCQSKHFVFFRKWMEESLSMESGAISREKMTLILLITHTSAGILGGSLFSLIWKRLPKHIR